MKLFIKNKKYFQNTFNNLQLTKEIHKKAFNELKLSIDVNNSIPIWLTPEYKEDGIVLFNLVSFNNEMYVYEFNTTAS